jgi:translation initiation factor IF-3
VDADRRSTFFVDFRRCFTIKKSNDVLINEQIRAKEVRVISAEGEALGVMPAKDAQKIADEKELDLVLISPNANPPVCKIIDFGKYRFELAKKEKEAKKKQKTVSIKEVRLSAKIEKHDLEIKLNQTKKFISAGNKVKLSIRFRGREIAYKDIGLTIMSNFIKDAEEFAKIDKPAKLEGRSIIAVIAPKN